MLTLQHIGPVGAAEPRDYSVIWWTLALLGAPIVLGGLYRAWELRRQAPEPDWDRRDPYWKEERSAWLRRRG